jgi:hypothetical protein
MQPDFSENDLDLQNDFFLGCENESTISASHTWGATTFRITALGKTTFSITILSKKRLFVTLSKCDIEHK